MVSYYCNLENDYGIGLIVVDTDNKIKAINMIFHKLISVGFNDDFSYRFIKERVKELKKDEIVYAYQYYE